MPRDYPTTREFIEFQGIRYYREKQGWRCSSCHGHERLARAVWRHHHGEIPPNTYVACIDGDNWNNDLANLELRPKGSSPERMEAMKRMPKWSGEQERKLRSLHAMGISQNAIAAILGVRQGALSPKIQNLDRGARHFWTDERMAQLRALAKDGSTPAQMAEAIGCKRTQIYAALAHHQIECSWRFWTDERVERLTDLFTAGRLTIQQIAAELGCSKHAAWARWCVVKKEMADRSRPARCKGRRERAGGGAAMPPAQPPNLQTEPARP